MDEKLNRRDALQRELDRRQLTASDLARMSGGQPSYYYDLLRGTKSFGERAARSIETLLGLPRGALDRNSDFDHDTQVGVPADTVPLLDWAFAFRSDARPLERVPCPVPHSPETIAVRVVGDSMDAPTGRRYPAGCTVFVDPKVEPSNGRAVLARLPGGDTTLKLLRLEDGRRWLQPLHPQYPPIAEPFQVLGTVVGTFFPE